MEQFSNLSAPAILQHTHEYVNWNNEMEKVVNDISEKCCKYHHRHLEIALSYSKYYNNLMILLIVLNPLSGTISMLSFINFIDSMMLNIASSSLSFISGILASIIKFGRYDEISNAHKTASSRYISLTNNIARQLVLDKEDRMDAKEYLQWLMTSYDELYQSSPLIPNIIAEKPKDDITNDDKQLHVFSQSQDLNKYSDGLMRYQINRYRTNV